MSVREAMEKVSDEEFNYWRAFNRTNPISLERFDYLAASLMVATMTPHMKKGKTLKTIDLMPKWGESGNMSPEAMEKLLSSFAAKNNQRFE